MEQKRWFNCRFHLFIIVFIALLYTIKCSSSKISDMRLCADDECKTVLSLAKTLARHQNNDPIFLSFSRGEVVQVLSKSAGNRPDLWGGQIGGRKGYFPRSFVREYKVDIPNPGKIVPTEGNAPKVPNEANKGQKDDTELDDDTEIEVEDEGYQSDGETKEGNTEKSNIKIEEPNDRKEGTEVKDNKTDETVDSSQDGTEVADNQQDGTEVVDNKQDGTEVVDNKQDGTEVEDNKQDGTEIVDNKQDGTEIVDNKQDVKEVVDSKQDGAGLSKDKTNDEEAAENKPDETEIDLDAKVEEKKSTDEARTQTDDNLTRDNNKEEPERKENTDSTEVDETELGDDSDETDKRDDTNKSEEEMTTVETNDVSHATKDETELKDDKQKKTADDSKQNQILSDQNQAAVISEQKKDDVVQDQGTQLKQEQFETKLGVEKVESTEIQREERESEIKEVEIIESDKGLQIEDIDDKQPENIQKSDQLKTENQVEIKPTSVVEQPVSEKSHQDTSLKNDTNIQDQQINQINNVNIEQLQPTPAVDTPQTTIAQQSLVQPFKTETLEEKEMNGFTIIDGTPFPLDMFEDAEPQKTALPEVKKESSMPIVVTKATEAVVAGQMTASQQNQNTANANKQLKQQTGEHTEQKTVNTTEQKQPSQQEAQAINKELPLQASQQSGHVEQKQPSSQGGQPNQVPPLQTSEQGQTLSGQVELTPKEFQQNQLHDHKKEEQKEAPKEPEVITGDQKVPINQQMTSASTELGKDQQVVVDKASPHKDTPQVNIKQAPLESDVVVKSVKFHPDVEDVTEQYWQQIKEQSRTLGQESAQPDQTGTHSQQSKPTGTPLVHGEPPISHEHHHGQHTGSHQHHHGQHTGSHQHHHEHVGSHQHQHQHADSHQHHHEHPGSHQHHHEHPGSHQHHHEHPGSHQHHHEHPGSHQHHHEHPGSHQHHHEHNPSTPKKIETPVVHAAQQQQNQHIPQHHGTLDNKHQMNPNKVEPDIPHTHVPHPGDIQTPPKKVQEEIKPIGDSGRILHDNKITNEASQGEIKGSASVAEQLMSSMNFDIPKEHGKQQATMILQDKTDIKFGIANGTDTKMLADTEPMVQDVYRTADFISRKILSHNTDANIASVQTENVQPDVKSPESGSEISPETVTPQSVQEEIPPPPKQEDVTSDPLIEPQDHVLTRKINDGKLEEMEDKEYQDQQSWKTGFRSMEGTLKVVVEKLPPSLQSLLEQEPLGLTPQMTVLVTMVTFVTLMVVTCVTCLFGGKKKMKKTDPIVVVKGLEEKLFIATKERENLEEELENSQKRVKELEQEVKLQTSSSGNIATEVDKYKVRIKEYESTVSSQESELEKLSAELSQKQKDLQSKTHKLEESQKQLKKKEQAIEEVAETLKSTNKELDSVKSELKAEKAKNESNLKQIEQLETSKQQLLQEAEDWNEKVHELTERLEASHKGQTQIQEDLAYKENELEVLRDCFIQLKGFENEESENQDDVDGSNIQEKLKAMMDVSAVNARLKTVEDEKNLIQNRIDIEVQSRMDMEEQIAELESKIEAMKTDKMKAERQSHEATTKLNVLTNYFKEKEAQLQRELGEQEALKKQNINKLENADEVAKMAQEELESYKLQTEDLKKEILSAERDFRSQIAANEKKAHDNWLSARAAERELKESRNECSVLRQKLTDLERRLMQGPSGLIRPLPTRGMPPPGMINGPPLPPGMDRPGSRGGPFPPPPPPGLRDDDMRGSPGPVRLPPHDRRGPRMPPPDLRSPPPFGRGPPPPMDRRSPPPYDRLRGPPGHRMPPPPDMLPPHLRGPPPPHGPSPPPREPPSSRHGAGTPRHRTQGEGDHHPPRQSSQV